MLPTPVPDRLNLLCVLDWGLGHAARSLALARQLEQAGERVVFAASGSAKAFLERERPDLETYALPAYGVTYPTRWMPLNVARQFPRWVRTIVREHRRTARLVRLLGVGRVISDSRFGCYHRQTESIFLTHQLHPITHNCLVSAVYRRYLQRFDRFWVPDFAEPARRISGGLSSPVGYGPVRYVGLLSRLAPSGVSSREPFTVLALLSGPEPMRSRLEARLLGQLGRVAGNHVLVRGLPDEASPVAVPPNVGVYPFAEAGLLSSLLATAEYVVCRSGYSTLMDVYAVTDPAKLILVPTPGQTEQAYLAARMAERAGSVHVPDQRALDLPTLLGERRHPG